MDQRRRATRFALCLCAFLFAACQKPGRDSHSLPNAPRAPREPITHTLHGETWTDEYAWLANRDDPRVRAYLDLENAYADAWFRPLRALENTLYQEMIARIPAEDSTVPEAIGANLYYRRLVAGAEYVLHCRRRAKTDTAAPAAPEEILLDENALAAGQPFFKLGALRVSPAQSRIAYTTDTKGNERYSLHIKDLPTGRVRTLPVRDGFEHVEWSGDGNMVYYTTVDATNRPARLWRIDLRSESGGQAPQLVYEETDPAFYLTLSKTRDERYLLVTLESNTTSEVRVMAARREGAPLEVLIPRSHGIQYKADHQDDSFFLLTNKNAPNFHVVRVHENEHDWRAAQVVLTECSDTRPEKIDLFADHLVVTERQNGFLQLRVLDRQSSKSTVIPKPEPIGTVQVLANPDFSSRRIRFVYSSPTCPDSVLEYDTVTGATQQLKQLKIQGFDPARVKAELHWSAAPDGAAVPISLARPSATDGPLPLLLEGYGAYGISSDPVFDSSLVSLLERGFVIATAHVRGGGELGRAWYEAGKGLQKRNTFADFRAAAEHLHAARISTPDRTAIRGASAGGLLIGAVLNQRPSLCRAAIAEVPFVDVVHTLLDPSVPLTVIEWEEWGNPNNPREFRNLRSYSPFDNVAGLEYPHLLVTAGFVDPRVGYWEPAKWVARLRARKRGDGVLLLRTQFGAGHEGPSGRLHLLRDRARQYAFLLDRLGLADGKPDP